MKKHLLLFAMILLPLVASADAVEINGIYYNLITKAKQAEVTKNPNNYTGSVVIPEKVTYENVEYSVTSIGGSAFSSCFDLTSVTIPNSVISIGDYAFEVCSGLTSITIPNSVTSIGDCAFVRCSGLTSITIPNSVTSIGNGAFYYCSSLTSITIPNSVTSIGNIAFSGCSGLTSITIPNSVTSIGYNAFENCSGLTSITIGNGIKNIFGSAFASCPDLTDVTCYAGNVPSTNTDAFKDSYIEYATLHVPASAVNAYKAADPWKNFKSIMATDGTTPETPETPKCEKPTISYENGQLKMSCATEGVEYVTDITDADIKKHYDATISLTATYNISVYATKSGYDNSETATATLCWIDQQPKTEGITNGIANIPANAVLIQSEGGSIKVQGVDEGTQVNVYSINGTQAGSAISQSGVAIVNTNLQPGSIAIVKIGQKSVKVVIK